MAGRAREVLPDRASATTSGWSRPTTSREQPTLRSCSDQGAKSVFILNDKETYGLGVATDTKNSAKKLGLKVVGFTCWDPKASSYEALATRIKQSGADWVYLGGLICNNGAKLI